MKQKFLCMLPFLFFAAAIVSAQTPEPTNYRGAFAPAPVAQWTDNWTNWDPQNTFYPAPTVNVSGVITSNTTWTKNNTYLLQGIVYVDSLVTLTIEAGTVVRGDANTVISSLVIERGATIIANGTACNPIVFTSSKAAGSRAKGDWGGLTILGRGLTNQGNDVPIEGIGTSEPRARYGGNNNADNSGSLKYIRIEYAGYAISANVELNSLTFGGVGSGTTVDYVQTSFGNDDAFEWFGGAVNAKHLVAYRTLDDDFDTDFGYSGLVQFGLAIKDPTVADDPAVSTSEGFESDNNAAAPFTPTPKTSASFYNITQIGAFRCGSNAGGITQPAANGFRRGVRLRRNTELKIFNSIFMNNWRGLVMDADVIANGLAAFKNNIIAMDLTTVWVGPTYAGAAVAAENAATNTYLTAAANANTIVTTPCDILVNAWDFLNPDFRPNAIGSGGALSGSDLTPGIQLETASFPNLNPRELVVDIFENGVGNSNGTITLTITVPSAFTVAVPGITLSGTDQSGSNGTFPNLGVSYNNGDWLFKLVGGNIVATSKPGVVITQANLTSLGFTIRRNNGVAPGTLQNLAVNVSGGADTAPDNNSSFSGISAP
ncbi:MAG: cell shape-determining protein MreB [Rhizobacter sp.]|nr:cell shape-determining protein MreB [Ferruginibacter sp.]